MSVSSPFREDVIHNKTRWNSQWKWEFEFESVLLWNHWYYSERIKPPVFGVCYVSHQIFACSFTSNELLSRQGRVTVQPLYSLVNSTKISGKIFSMLKLLLWKALSHQSFLMFLNDIWIWTRMNSDQFLKWFWKYKVAFPTIYLLLSASLTVGVSTASYEACFSSVVRILTPCRGCTRPFRGVTRFDSAQGKKQVWRHHVRIWGL